MTNLELKERVNRSGELADVVEQFQPGTILEAAEVMKERKTLPEKEGVADLVDGGALFWSESFPLQTNFVWTGNFAMYTHEGGDAILYLGGNEANPFFNTERVREHRRATARERYIHYAGDDFRPTQSDIDAVLESVASGTTVRINLSHLDLTERGPVDGKAKMVFNYNAKESSAAGRVLAERVSGSDGYFPEILVERPEYILSAVKDAGRGAQPTDAIVRACSLQPNQFDQGFNADVWVLGHTYSMRGIPVFTAQDEAKMHSAYEALFEYPDLSVALIDPESCHRMGKILKAAEQKGGMQLDGPARTGKDFPGNALVPSKLQQQIGYAYATLLKVPEATAKLMGPQEFHLMSKAVQRW